MNLLVLSSHAGIGGSQGMYAFQVGGPSRLRRVGGGADMMAGMVANTCMSYTVGKKGITTPEPATCFKFCLRVVGAPTKVALANTVFAHPCTRCTSCTDCTSAVRGRPSNTSAKERGLAWVAWAWLLSR